MEDRKLEDKVVEVLQSIYDPDIPVDIYNLGLIYEVKIDVFFPKSFDEKTQKILEKAGLTCPIANSLHPNLNQRIRFIWPS